jgi:hypothetical protein
LATWYLRAALADAKHERDPYLRRPQVESNPRTLHFEAGLQGGVGWARSRFQHGTGIPHVAQVDRVFSRYEPELPPWIARGPPAQTIPRHGQRLVEVPGAERGLGLQVRCARGTVAVGATRKPQEL